MTTKIGKKWERCWGWISYTITFYSLEDSSWQHPTVGEKELIAAEVDKPEVWLFDERRDRPQPKVAFHPVIGKSQNEKYERVASIFPTQHSG